MQTWQLRASDLKNYPHFDKFLPRQEAERIATSPERVRTNAFFPFLCYNLQWQPFRPHGKAKKVRPIRYASRRDAYIFARYRHLLSEKYEAELAALGIQDCPIAYRKIPIKPGTRQGKCNIHFAKDAFDTILGLGNCCAVALDISSFFENIDHNLLRVVWCRMIGEVDLPPDHAVVFRAITGYSVVDRNKLYERLGYIGTVNKNGRQRKGYLKGYKEMPTQLCSPKVFRQMVAGGDPEFSSLIEQNEQPFGIPQGAPISDILANIYLIDFDVLTAKWVRSRGGVYFRYSDDILIVVPGGVDEGRSACDYACGQVIGFGDRIQIKQDKCSIVRYCRNIEGGLEFCCEEGQGKNGLEYLGFRFDGRRIYLRDSTLSGFYRKMTYSLRHEARALVARYPGKDLPFLTSAFNLEKFAQRFGRVEDFDANTDYRHWTFWTYARRAVDVFGPSGLPILDQLRRHRQVLRARAERELLAAVEARKN